MKGYLGIDNGTQGLSVVFCDEDLKVVATGEGSYGFVFPDSTENSGREQQQDEGASEATIHGGFYEQNPADWDAALLEAMEEMREEVFTEPDVLAIGISGQMHGEVCVDENNQAIGNTVRLWCDARNQAEGEELTALFGVKVPKRSTCARFLWTIRNQPWKARATRRLTTPAGWTSFKLTGQWTLGIGDASGMFPVDTETMDYDETLLATYDALVQTIDPDIPPLKQLLPTVVKAGEGGAGVLSQEAADWLDLVPDVPVAAAEGDQPAAMAGSLLAEAGMVSMSFGTSVVANSVGDRAFEGVSPGVDQFCAADGKPINMIWIRNGTTFMNSVVEMFGSVFSTSGKAITWKDMNQDDKPAASGSVSIASSDDDNDVSGRRMRKNTFSAVMPQLLEASPDCGGLVALPFMDDEPGVNVKEGGTALVVGWNATNATPGNVAKAALLAPIYNLKIGMAVLDEQGYPPSTEIVLSGGLTKTPECSQIVADVFNRKVTLLESGEEGSAWGAAVLAKYRHECSTRTSSEQRSWASFVQDIKTTGETRTRTFQPNPQVVPLYERHFEKYQRLLKVQPKLSAALSPSQ